MRSPAWGSVISSSCNPENPSSSRYSARCRSNGGNSTKRAFTRELYATCVGTQVAYRPLADGTKRQADVPSLFHTAREWHRNDPPTGRFSSKSHYSAQLL